MKIRGNLKRYKKAYTPKTKSKNKYIEKDSVTLSEYESGKVSPQPRLVSLESIKEHKKNFNGKKK
jgi:hypothetical protein